MAWWELPEQDCYLWEHLIEHLIAAGRREEAEETVGDLRWIGVRLQASGPAEPYTDLALIGTPRSERLRRLPGRAAHLFAPTDPRYSQLDIVYSRVSHDPDWEPRPGSCRRPVAGQR